MIRDVNAVLNHLGVEQEPPSLAALDRLVAAYVRRVPWESASRIVRRAEVEALHERPRWPETFWAEALAQGTGGTCFESNYAFFDLLRLLGYSAVLTINNMRDAIGCHTALVVSLEGAPYLVDVGLPLYIPIPLNPAQVTQRESLFHTYPVTPQGSARFLVERDRHPRPDCFTLVGLPVTEADYRAATIADYDEDGLFLDRVVINKVVDEMQWRFGSEGDPPYHLESFDDGDKTYHQLPDDHAQVAAAISERFGIERGIVASALALLGESGYG
jgi:arylamine N-acetyltransferase